MSYIFKVTQSINDETISVNNYIVTNWVDITGLSGANAQGKSTIANPLNPEETYVLERYNVNSTILNAVKGSAPNSFNIGTAGASSETTPKIIKIENTKSGWYYEIKLNPVTGSSTNCRIEWRCVWGSNTSGSGYFNTHFTYSPQNTEIVLHAIKKTDTISGNEYDMFGFLIEFSGGAPTSSSSYPARFISAESSFYGTQTDPLPQATTQGGGGFGTYNNATDVTVNIGVKPSGFLSGVLGGSGFNFYYVPSYHDLIKAAYYSLNGVNNLSDFVNNTAALILNPSTYIVSACCIPVDKSAFGAGSMQNTIRLGGLLNFNVNCYPLGQLWADSPVWYQDLSNMYYDSFMDYEPYTKMHLFLPYIGMVPLNASQCMGGSITVQYRFEGITGKCVAFVKTTDKKGRNTGFYQYAGDAGYSLPWVGNNGGGSQMIHSAASAAIGLAAGKADVPTVSGLLQTAEKFYAQESRPQMQGGFGVNTGALGGDDIVLFIQRAQNAMPDKYYDVHGYQTATGGKIGDYSGFTRFDFVEISTDATPEENAEIETALKEGVFL